MNKMTCEVLCEMGTEIKFQRKGFFYCKMYSLFENILHAKEQE